MHAFSKGVNAIAFSYFPESISTLSLSISITYLLYSSASAVKCAYSFLITDAAPFVPTK